MRVEQNLVAFLKASSAITDIVQNRISPVVIPQSSALPALVYRRAGYDGAHTFTGAVKIPTVRIELTSWDDDYNGTKQLADELRKLLDGYSGQMGTMTAYFVQLTHEDDTYDTQLDLYGTRSVYDIAAQEI